MESCYGIGINNRYALFLGSDDEGSNVEDLVVKQAATAGDSKAAKASDAKVNGAPVKKDAARTQAKDKTTTNREDKENRINRDGKRPQDASRRPQDNREDRNNRRNRDGGVEGGDAGGRGGGRGGRGGRGGAGGRGGRGVRGGMGGRREFDRKSGDDKTGVKAVDKREGGGAYNWGSVNDELKAEQDTANTSTDNPEAAAGAPAAEGEGGEAAGHKDETPQEPREEEPITLTLEEYKAQQEKRTEHKFNLRKAGEGEGNIDPKWKKAYAYKKEKETVEEEEDDDDYYVSKNSRKKVVDIQFTFNDGGPARGGMGGRGGRGGPRGGRGGERGGRRDGPPRDGPRDGPREGGRGEGGPRRGDGPRRGGAGPSGPRGGGRAGKEAPDVFDATSFPSLG